MVIKEDGTKWACQSCLKGHRVSGCNHTDRELIFVPKKGRPVTQCHHCRAERKKRSAHVKCDCGDKAHHKEKCIHLREAEAKLGGEQSPSDLGQLPGALNMENHGCCCHHGEKCTCSSLKVEPIQESMEEYFPKPPPQSRPKPRLVTTQSDGHLTVFANGHHKPVHRNNFAAHECGMPYKLPRSHTVHNLSANPARRSVDSLALPQSSVQAIWQQQYPTSTTTPDSRVSQSENGSPRAGPFEQAYSLPTDAQFFQGSSGPFAMPETSASDNSKQNMGFDFNDSQLPASTVDNQKTMNTWSAPPSATNLMDWNLDWIKNTQPALTTSSATLSEVDELPSGDDLHFPELSSQPQHFNSQMDFGLDNLDVGNSDACFSVESMPANRWSLPASFWQDSAANLPTGTDSGSTATSKAPSPAEVKMPSSSLFVPDQSSPFQNDISTMSGDAFQSMAPTAFARSSRPRSVHAKRDGMADMSDWTKFLGNMDNSGPQPISVNNFGSAMFPTSDFSLPGSSNQASTATSAPSLSDTQPSFEQAYGYPMSAKDYQMNDTMSNVANQDYLNSLDFSNIYANTNLGNDWAS